MVEKESKLFLFQANHLTAEMVGFLIESLYTWGAENVLVTPALTRNNQSVHLVLVESGNINEANFLQDLASEFGISAYHRLTTTQSTQMVLLQERELTVRYGGKEFKTSLVFTQIGDASVAPPPVAVTILAALAPPELIERPITSSSPLYFRIEPDNLKQVKTRIQEEFGLRIALSVLQGRLETLLASGEALILELKKPLR